MKKFNRLPIPNSRMGILMTVIGIEKTAIIEYGPSGTTHFAMDFLMGTNFERLNLFSAHIKENDLLFGETERLEKAIKELDRKEIYKYIFVSATSLTALVGIDIVACCKLLQSEIKAKLIPIEDSGSYGDIAVGIENGFYLLVKEINKKNLKEKNGYFNIIGPTKNDCFYKSDIKIIEDIMNKYFNLKLNTVLNVGTKVEKIERLYDVDINIVTRPEGIKAAEFLKENYDIPYVVVNFYGTYSIEKSLQKIGKTLNIDSNIFLDKNEIRKIDEIKILLRRELKDKDLKVVISGNYFEVCGLCNLLENDLNIKIKRLIVNHKISSIHKAYYKEYEDKIVDRDNWNESEDYDLILGDEEILKYLEGDIKIRVSNPNIKFKYLSTSNSFMGTEGILKMGEIIFNQHK
ncbi:nitrogenase component 1 [Fusobacterium sp.]|uniref:nitrogenase component 1 n=1 Tax=Fusobacterium sp. TaxID=68766 RepID=UPI001D861651|nr:nitrogenase component 1 [Fusobacterium sp.]MBS5789939.1 hypothetical protein [Fusobacterium sp.]